MTRKAAGGRIVRRGKKYGKDEGGNRKEENERSLSVVPRLDSPSKFIGRGEREMSLDSLSFTSWSFVFLPPPSREQLSSRRHSR